MQNKIIKFAGLTLLFGLIIALAIACKVEAAAPSDDTSGGAGTTPITVTVDGGTSYTVASDGTAEVPDPTARAGYDFIGWTKTKDGNSVDFVRNSTKVTTSITIYPIWDTALSSKITFTKDFTSFHAFQYQVTITDLKADTNLEFIASSSATDPGYNNIKDDGALRSAYFTPTFLKRGVYFSFKNGGSYDAKNYPVLTTITGLYEPTNNKNYIDLKTKSQQSDVQTAIESVSPALLSPGGTYYIHVYRNGTHVKSSEAITLPYYPTTWPIPVDPGTYSSADPNDGYPNMPAYNINEYLFGRSDFTYSTTSDKSTNKTFEWNQDEVNAISNTMVLPFINPKTSCGTNPSLNYYMYKGLNPNGTPNTSAIFSASYPMINKLDSTARIVFAPPTNYGTNYTNESSGDKYFVLDYINLIIVNKLDLNGYYAYNSIGCSLLNTRVISKMVEATAVNMKVYDK